jgi:hypothetical protein
MRYQKIGMFAGAIWAMVVPASPNAQSQTPTPSPALLATLEARNLSNIHGNVSVTPQGSGSMVRIQFTPQSLVSQNQSLMLMSGADCMDMARRAGTMIPLNAIAGNPVTGRVSRTLVAIPFSAFKSRHFIVDVRNATSRAQLAEACAHL